MIWCVIIFIRADNINIRFFKIRVLCARNFDKMGRSNIESHQHDTAKKISF